MLAADHNTGSVKFQIMNRYLLAQAGGVFDWVALVQIYRGAASGPRGPSDVHSPDCHQPDLSRIFSVKSDRKSFKLSLKYQEKTNSKLRLQKLSEKHLRKSQNSGTKDSHSILKMIMKLSDGMWSVDILSYVMDVWTLQLLLVLWGAAVTAAAGVFQPQLW